MSEPNAAPMSPDDRYPRTLHPSNLGRGFVLVVALAFPALAWFLLRGGIADGASPLAVAYFGWLGLAGWAAILMLLRKVFGQRLVLQADGVELLGPGARRARMQWADVAGYRVTGVALLLVPRDAGARALEIELHFDRESLKRQLPEGLAELGAPARLERRRGLLLAMDAAMILLDTLFRNLLAALGIVALLPLTILLAMSAKGERRIGLVMGEREAPILVAVSGPLVAACALSEARPVPGFAPWVVAILGGALLALLIRSLQSGAWTPLFAGLYLPGLGAWALGLVLVVNGLFDGAPPEKHRPVIVARANPAYDVLALAPWGPFQEPTRIRVKGRLYEAAVTGGTALVTLHRGALGIPWYRIESVSGP